MKERKINRLAAILGIIIALLMVAIPVCVFADEMVTTTSNPVVAEAKVDNVIPVKAIACAFTIAIPASVGAIAMAITSRKASESIARQPEAAGDIRTNTMLSLVFLETLVIYALLAVILIIFTL